MTATLKRIEALLGGAPEPPRRRSAARRSLSPQKRRAASPRKKAVDADLPPPPPPPTRGHRGCYDRAFRTSNSFSLAWPEDGAIAIHKFSDFSSRIHRRRALPRLS